MKLLEENTGLSLCNHVFSKINSKPQEIKVTKCHLKKKTLNILKKNTQQDWKCWINLLILALR